MASIRQGRGGVPEARSFPDEARVAAIEMGGLYLDWVRDVASPVKQRFRRAPAKRIEDCCFPGLKARPATSA